MESIPFNLAEEELPVNQVIRLKQLVQGKWIARKF